MTDFGIEIQKIIPLEINPGTVRIWNNWHGRPYDNVLRIISIDYFEEDKLLQLKIGEKDTTNIKVNIFEPNSIEVTSKKISIAFASKVRLEIKANGKNHFREYEKLNSILLKRKSNMDLFTRKLYLLNGNAFELVF